MLDHLLTIGHVWPGYTWPVVMSLPYRTYLLMRAAAELYDKEKRAHA